jgi:hypothetical protein
MITTFSSVSVQPALRLSRKNCARKQSVPVNRNRAFRGTRRGYSRPCQRYVAAGSRPSRKLQRFFAPGDSVGPREDGSPRAPTPDERRHAVEETFGGAAHFRGRVEALSCLDRGADTKAPKVQAAPVGADKVIRRDEYDRLMAAATKRDGLLLRYLWTTWLP